MSRGGAPGFDVVVVGAGVVGLAAAAALAGSGRSVLILERHGAIARETTSRNSEVVHAGIYDPPGSLKATLCVEGRERLYQRCSAWGIGVQRIGKLVVATSDAERDMLAGLQRRGRANGVPGLEILDRADVRRREPSLEVVGALWSPATGIVDAHALALSYLAEAERAGAVLALGTTLAEVDRRGPGYALGVLEPGGGEERIGALAVVNAGGLDADRVAALAGLDVDALGLRQHRCKGDYFALAPGRRIPLRHLVYPVPQGAGLGIHATVDLGGRLRFGPDAEYVNDIDYAVDPAKAERFARAVMRYLPGIESNWLAPDGAGIRPKLAGPGEGFRDFVVAERSGHGLPGWVDCIGIESPGLTAAGAIAARIESLLAGL